MELQLLQEADLPTFDILKSATINAASLFAEEVSLGSVVVRKKVEFLLVSSNPLVGITTLKQPTSMMANGTWYDSAAMRFDG
jgi:imidazolonepropionase-like amidohydrolase